MPLYVSPTTTVRKNGSGGDLARRRLNFVEGSGVTLTLDDDPTDNEIDVTIAASGNGFDPRTAARLTDDFLTGTTTGGSIGLGWNLNGMTASVVASEANHPGIWRFTSGASNPTTASAQLRNGATVGIVVPGDPFDMLWVARYSINSGNENQTLLRIGMSSDPANTGQATHGIYFEKLTTDTNWFSVTRVSGSETRHDMGVAALTATWYRFRIRRATAGGNIIFTLNSGSDYSEANTIPSAALHPEATTRTTEAVAKIVDLDLFDLQISGITR